MFGGSRVVAGCWFLVAGWALQKLSWQLLSVDAQDASPGDQQPATGRLTILQVYFWTAALVFNLLSFGTVYAQQNLFNVPSSDITEKGKVFFPGLCGLWCTVDPRSYSLHGVYYCGMKCKLVFAEPPGCAYRDRVNLRVNQILKSRHLLLAWHKPRVR